MKGQTYDRANSVRLICPLLSGPKSMLFWITKEIGNAIEEAQAGGDYRQADALGRRLYRLILLEPLSIIAPDLEQGSAAPNTRLVTKKSDLAWRYRSVFEQLVEAERHTDL